MTVTIGRVEVTTASEIGATHRQRGRGCEDAVGWRGADGTAVLATVAIADGHSDQRCVRSGLGAEFAVAAATTLPSDVIDGDALADALIADWRRRVDGHLAGHPLEGAEAGDGDDAQLSAEVAAAWAANARIGYGTTAVLCRVRADAISVVRVGDGDVIAVGRDGVASRLAIVERRADGGTESMSHPDARSSAHCVRIPSDAAPVLLMLSTDGFDNAYPSDESMLRAARELAAHRRDSGRPISADMLTAWAREAADVSGDDATVAVLWIETAP